MLVKINKVVKINRPFMVFSEVPVVLLYKRCLSVVLTGQSPCHDMVEHELFE